MTFDYEDTGVKRDWVKSQTWGTDDRPSATFQFDVASNLTLPSSVTVTDTRGQRRAYTFFGGLASSYHADRPHLQDVTEDGVATWNGSAFGALPPAVSKNDATHVGNISRKTIFGYENGRLHTIATEGGASSTIGYENAGGGDLGRMVHQIDAAGGLGAWQQTMTHTDDGLAFVKSVQGDGTDPLNVAEPRAGPAPATATNAGVTRTVTHYPSGLPNVMTSTGDGAGSKVRVEYYPANDELFRRSMPSDVFAGNDNVKSHFDYPSVDRSIESAPRDVSTTTERDELGRPIHITSTGSVSWPPRIGSGTTRTGGWPDAGTSRRRTPAS